MHSLAANRRVHIYYVRTFACSCFLLLGAFTAAHGGWFSYDSYEDCMLGRMKGQNLSMYANADKVCKKQFNVEFDISVPMDEIEWGYRNFHVFIEVHSKEYIATRGKFSFSSKDC